MAGSAPHLTPSLDALSTGMLKRKPRVPALRAFSVAPAGAPFYPSDLTFGGGRTVEAAVQHAVFINCKESERCWGAPALFLQRLGRSKMIHLVDQYVGKHGDNRYTVGSSLSVTTPIDHVLGMDDVLGILHGAALAIGGNGYGEIYHLFFPKGVEVCDGPASCYAPNDEGNSTYTWCALHASHTFSDIGHVLYTVEMYQTGTCLKSEENPYPNGLFEDSTMSMLSHELFETITDPDPDPDLAHGVRVGWQARSYYHVAGDEMGDLCEGSEDQREHFVTSFDGHDYSTQLEYSNASHSCTNGE